MDAAATDGAESAFDMAMVVNGVLMILGGIVAGFGLRNPKRAEEQDRARHGPAGECARSAGDGTTGTGPHARRPRSRRRPEPVSIRAAMKIFSGIQPTGRKHLGNYIGAIRQYVDGQNEGDPAIYCIVDLHAITVPWDPTTLRTNVYDTTAILLAAGLDPERCILFRQSDVREHTELTWYLAAFTAHGDLNRMTQFKDKSAKQRAGLRGAVLLSGAAGRRRARLQGRRGPGRRGPAPARRADARDRPPLQRAFGGILVEPEHRIPEVGARIMDLQDPTVKMSTTGGSDQGTVYVLDEPEGGDQEGEERGHRLGLRGEARGRGQGGDRQPDRDPLGRPREGRWTRDRGEFEGSGYGDFKAAVAESVVEFLAPVRERYEELRPDEAALERTLEAGAEKAARSRPRPSPRCGPRSASAPRRCCGRRGRRR